VHLERRTPVRQPLQLIKPIPNGEHRVQRI
jgi:hypothetical protein